MNKSVTIILILCVLVVAVFTYFDRQTPEYTWENVITLAQNCEVASVMVTNMPSGQELHITLKDGRKFVLQEFPIDIRSSFINENSERCGNVQYGYVTY